MTTRTSTSPAETTGGEQQFFRTLNRFVEPAVRAGLGNSFAGAGAFVVETTGRRSGLPRRVPLLGKRVGDTIIVSTTRDHSQWIRNLEHHPSRRLGRRSTTTSHGHRGPSAQRRRRPPAARILTAAKPLTNQKATLGTRSGSMIEQVIERWHQYLRGDLPGGLDELLDDDVVFYSPIVHTPQRGKEITKLYLQAAAATLPGDQPSGSAETKSVGSFRYTKQVAAGDTAVLEFETSVQGKYVNGVDIIRCNTSGRIVEFRVMIRPLQAINIVHEQMKTMLQTLQPNR